MNFGTFMRFAAIVLGIASTVHMASYGFQIPLNAYLGNIIDLYDSALGIVAILVEPAAKIIFARLHQWFSLDLQLLPHWKHVFVLTWLFFGAQARAGWAPVLNRWGKAKFDNAWGLGCALLGAIAAGMVPLSHPAAFLWPVAACILYRTGKDIWMARFFARMGATSNGSNFDWFAFLGKSMTNTIRQEPLRALIAAVFGYGIITSPSPALVSLIIFVAIQGYIYLDIGVHTNTGGEEGNLAPRQTPLNNPATRTGLDILGVLGGAACVIWLSTAMA